MMLRRFLNDISYFFQKIVKLNYNFFSTVSPIIQNLIYLYILFNFYSSFISAVFLQAYSRSLDSFALGIGLYVVSLYTESFLPKGTDRSGFFKVSTDLLIVLLILLLAGYLSIYFPWDSLNHYKLSHINDEFKLNIILGALGDYFGGVLNPLLSFFTILILVLQHKEISRREDERDIRQTSSELKRQSYEDEQSIRENERDLRSYLTSKNNEFYRDLDYIRSHYDYIKFKDFEGLKALMAYNDLSENQKSVLGREDLATINATIAPVIEMTTLIIKGVLRELSRSNLHELEIAQSTKHYEYLKSIMNYTKLKALVDVVKFADKGSLTEGDKWLIMFFEKVSIAGKIWPDAKDKDNLVVLLNASLRIQV